MMSWFKRKKQAPQERLLSFNAEELGAHMQRLAVELFRCRGEDSVKVITAIVETARNIQIIEINRIPQNKGKLEHLEHQLGRLAALSDMAQFVKSSLDPEVYAQLKEPQKKNIKVLQRDSELSKPVI